MRSIDRLREWWQDRFPVMDRQLGRDFREHIDAIEREVEELRDRDYRNGREDAEGAEGAVEFADRLKASATNRADVTLFGVDYTALPVDADGEAIHVGDVMEWPDCSTAEVVGIGNDTFFFVEDGEDAADWSRASDKIHHHAPTVEDVLREFAHVGIRIAAKHGIKAGEVDFYADEEAVAEYAARLRLAGDE